MALKLGKQLEEARKVWVSFLLAGVLIVAINASITTYVSTNLEASIIEQLKGPPCRINSDDNFDVKVGQEFIFRWSITNLYNERQVLDKIEAVCYQHVVSSEGTIGGIINVEQVTLGPDDPPVSDFLTLDDYVVESTCYLSVPGDYEFTLNTETNKGICTKTVHVSGV